jgi:hypothetical protein
LLDIEVSGWPPIWAGFHYRFSTRVGKEMGREIGEYVVKTTRTVSPRLFT